MIEPRLRVPAQAARLMKNVLLLAALITLAACSGKPSVSEIREQVASQMQADGRDRLFEIRNFRKRNGFRKDERTYIADVEYELVFRKSLADLQAELEKEAQDSPFRALSSSVEIVAMKLKFGNFKAGDHITRQAKLTLIRTEQGWRIQDTD
jgi:hypothetical protein